MCPTFMLAWAVLCQEELSRVAYTKIALKGTGLLNGTGFAYSALNMLVFFSLIRYVHI